MILYKPEQNPLTQKWEVKASFDNHDRVFNFDTEKEASDFILGELTDYASTGLTREEREFILANWDKMKLEKLVQATFKNPTLDGRSKQGRIMKKFLASRQFVPKPAYLDRLPDINLSESQKQFIRDNVTKGATSIDMARDIFGNASLMPLCKEHKAVDAYVKTLNATVTNGNKPVTLATSPYDPPKTVPGTIQRANTYRHSKLEADKLSVTQKKGLELLTSHLNNPRFSRIINAYVDEVDRESFESEFIQHVWDKPDLSTEEINLYINLCQDYILMFKIQAQIEALDNRMRDIVSDPNGEVSIKLTEAISVKTREYDQCFERHKKLIESLTGKRASRMDKAIKDNASVLSLIQAWKSEEERVRFIKMAHAKELEVRAEIDRIESMDSLKARILGIGVEEAIHGT